LFSSFIIVMSKIEKYALCQFFGLKMMSIEFCIDEFI